MIRSTKIEKAAKVLEKGGVVIFPTDTIYGIGCRYDNKKAIARIYKIKKTPRNQPYPILVSSQNQVKKLAKVNELGRKLIEKYWPGALTIVLESYNNSSKVGFRMPDSKLVLDLIKKIGVPIIGTSANFHGQKSPRSFKDLDPKFIKLADFIIKGRCQKGTESTVVDATVNPPKILRQGALRIRSV